MKHFYILFFFIAGCYCDTHYYPTRRTYNGCERFVDHINYKGGPIFLLLLIVILPFSIIHSPFRLCLPSLQNR